MFLRSRYSSKFQTKTDGKTVSTKKSLKKGAAFALKKESHFNYNADTFSIESVSSIGSGKNQIVAFVDLETSIKSKCSAKSAFLHTVQVLSWRIWVGWNAGCKFAQDVHEVIEKNQIWMDSPYRIKKYYPFIHWTSSGSYEFLWKIDEYWEDIQIYFQGTLE